MDTRLLVRRHREIMGGEQLFAVGAKLLGIYIAFRSVVYIPFLFMGQITREALIGSLIPLVFGMAVATLLLYRPRRLARRLGFGSGPVVNLPPARELLAIGLVLVGFSGFIDSSFNYLSLMAVIGGDLLMPRFEIFTRLIPLIVSLVLIAGGWTIAGWLVRWWSDSAETTEDPEVEMT